MGGGTWEGKEGKGRDGTGGSGRGAVGSRAGGDNRKRARSAQRRVGPKARPTASEPCARVAREGELSLVRALPLYSYIPLKFENKPQILLSGPQKSDI